MNAEHLSDLELTDLYGLDVVMHSARFRKVANAYARAVTFAYDHDLEAAARDTDAQVAETVAAWERANGIPVRDWVRIGLDEGRGDDYDDMTIGD